MEKRGAQQEVCMAASTTSEYAGCWEGRYLHCRYPISSTVAEGAEEEEEDVTPTTNKNDTARIDHDTVFMNITHHGPQSTGTITEKDTDDDIGVDSVGIFSNPPTPLLSVAFSVHADPPLS